MIGRTCAKCEEYKLIKYYHLNQSSCKDCYHLYYLENKSKYAKRQKFYIKSPKVKINRSINRREYYLNNKDHERLLSKEWEKRNKHIRKNIKAKYRASKLKANAQWSSNDKIKKIYKLCNKLCRDTGLNYEVDHVIPLQGKNVCGLHVETNLQILLQSENRSKGNKYEWRK